MIELAHKRTRTQKVFLLDDGRRRFDCHAGHIHYVDSSDRLVDVDYSLETTGSGWRMDKAGYALQVPRYSDGDLTFVNRYTKESSGIVTIAIANHVEGIYTGDSVVYTDAFGSGADYIVRLCRPGVRELVRINANPGTDVSFDFELVIPPSFPVLYNNQEWVKRGSLNYTGSRVLIGTTQYKEAYVWDSGRKRAAVDIQILKQGAKVVLRKTIPASFFLDAVFPVFTDHPTDYYSGSGDGYATYVDNGSLFNWNTVHDAATGTSAATTNIFAYTEDNVVSSYAIYRGFIPVDTSGVGAGADVTEAVLNLYCYGKSDTDNDGDDWVNIVQATAPANATTNPATADYDACGDINNPTEGSTRIDLTGMATAAYSTFTLNATGLDWLVLDGVTKFGVREGHDCIDSPTASGKVNYAGFRSSEQAGTNQDPYLAVTVAAVVTGRADSSGRVSSAARASSGGRNSSAGRNSV